MSRKIPVTIRLTVLPGLHLEPDPRRAVLIELVDVERVER